MTRIATLICIRSVYPHFLFKRGSTVHCLFMICLFALLASSSVGIFSVLKAALDHFSAPCADLLSVAGSAMGLWALVTGIRYGAMYG
jgi:hypothetical protein